MSQIGKHPPGTFCHGNGTPEAIAQIGKDQGNIHGFAFNKKDDGGYVRMGVTQQSGPAMSCLFSTNPQAIGPPPILGDRSQNGMQ